MKIACKGNKYKLFNQINCKLMVRILVFFAKNNKETKHVVVSTDFED